MATKSKAKPDYVKRVEELPTWDQQEKELMILERYAPLLQQQRQSMKTLELGGAAGIIEVPTRSIADLKAIVRRCREHLSADILSGIKNLRKKISLWPGGDLTTLEVDAIVNAANANLLAGGGGMNQATFRAGGPEFREIVDRVRRESDRVPLKPGEVISISARGRLKCKNVFFALAPRLSHQTHVVEGVAVRELRSPHQTANCELSTKTIKELRSCYHNSLDEAKRLGARTIGFCCLGVGMFALPQHEAAAVAVESVRSWFDASSSNLSAIDRIVFAVRTGMSHEAYEQLLRLYFPKPSPTQADSTARILSTSHLRRSDENLSDLLPSLGALGSSESAASDDAAPPIAPGCAAEVANGHSGNEGDTDSASASHALRSLEERFAALSNGGAPGDP